MINVTKKWIAGAAIALVALSTQVSSAQAVAPPLPNVIAHGTGAVTIAPDRVELLVRVETRSSTAARATEETARLMQAVIDTLRRGFNLGADGLATLGLGVQQEMAYPGEGRPPRVTGYIATNTVRVRSSETRRVGAILDAAVAAGATDVHGPNFFLADSTESRRRALAAAVAQARRDAEAMAAAAGGSLGDLLELASEPSAGGVYPMPRLAQAMRADAEMPVETTDLRISASVVAKWRFIRSR